MQPLRGLKILDFSTLLPGPFATMYLADWGAEVLRIEAPDRPDLSRSTPPFADGTSTTHAFLNRSKDSLLLDLKKPADLERIRELLESYDIVVEQFRPGVMEKLGLGYAALQKLNPKLIYCSITGYGQTGPYRDRAGHDINYAALSGLAAMTGSRETGPVLHGTPVCDLAGSFHALFALMTAVYHRQKTGEGQYIDVSITDSSQMLSALWMQMQLAAGQAPTWESTLLNGGSFYGYYRTKDRRYLSVGGLEPKFYKGFAEAIEALEILSLPPTRMAEVRRIIQQRIETRTLGEWMTIFSRLDVCVEPVLGFDEIADHPQFVSRERVAEVSCETSRGQKQLASPIRFSTFRPVYRFIGKEPGGR